MPDSAADFRREYRQRLPWPLAELYSRAFNRPAARSRHDNAFYLCEALVKLAASPAVACYLRELDRGGPRVEKLDRLLAQLARPSLGQWLAILRELARHFGQRVDAGAHPLGHLWSQLNAPRADLPHALALYRRIKNGADGDPASNTACSLLDLFNALVQYRNGVFGHGGPRFEAFFADEMGPLLLPALNDLLAEGVLDALGPPGTRLVYLAEQRTLDDGRVQIALRELVGADSERLAPLELDAAQAAELLPGRVAVLWPGHTLPLRLDPLLRFRESELVEEVLLLNSDLNGREAQYLSYTTGRTERDKTMAAALAALLSRLANRPVDEAELERLGQQSTAERMSVEPLFAAAAPTGQIVGDYQLLAELGRGGMGVVYLARQQSLGRLVALKMLPADLAESEVSLARFKREMRHLARTNHPHIVKVLDSGTLPDGRMYYTMEYIPGSDLEQVWRELSDGRPPASASSLGNSTWCRAVLGASRKQRARAEGSHAGHPPPQGAEPSAQPAVPPLPLPPLPELPELPDAVDDPGGYVHRVVMLVRDAALALQSVHDQGIVHRDVSPANLMLTPDGSRIVLMDFGLAKGQTASSLSQQGGFLGKLRYAAPEQLAAAMIKVGPAADIRGLGVTLWELLTRRRLFGDADERQLPELVQQHDVPALRSIDPSFDRDLEAIVARATERRTSSRIQSAGKLADYLQLYLDGQPLPIRPPGIGELLARWVREHRPLVASAATAAAAIVLVTALAFALINRARDEAITARNDAVDARHATEAANRQLGEANTNLAKSRDDALAAKHATEAANRQLAELNGQLKSAIAQLERTNVFLLATRGGETAARDSAEKLRELALATLNRVIVDIEYKLQNVPNAQALRRSLLATAMEGLTQISSHMAGDPTMLLARLELGDVFAQMGNSDGAGGLAKAREEYEAARSIAARLLAIKPADNWANRQLSISYNKLGEISQQTGQLAAAREYYEKSRAIVEQLAKADPSNAEAQRDLSVSYEKLGNISLQAGQPDAAREYYEKSRAIVEQLAKADPSNAKAQRDLSVSYEKLGNISLQAGQPDAAREYYGKSVAICEKLAKADRDNAQAQRDLSGSYFNVGNISLLAGQLDAARKYYEQSLTIREKLAKADPNNAQVQRDLCVSYHNLGEMSLHAGQLAAAREYHEKSVAIREKLAKADPDNAQAQRDLWVSNNKLGGISQQAGQLDAARKYYERSLTINEKLAKADPNNAHAQRDLCVSYHNLGEMSLHAGRLDAARKYYEQGLAINEKLAKADPNNAHAQRDLWVSYHNLGYVSLQAGQLDVARKYYEQGLAIREKLANADPNNAKAQQDLSNSYSKLGVTDNAAHRYAAAVGTFERAIGVLDKMRERGQFIADGDREMCMKALAAAKAAQQAVDDSKSVAQAPEAELPQRQADRAAGLAVLGKLAEAAEAAELLRNLKPRTADNLYSAACAYSLCAAHVDPKASDAEAQRRKFVDLALATLGEAIDAGFKNAAFMHRDCDLTAIRGLPPFAALVERAKAAANAAAAEKPAAPSPMTAGDAKP